MNPPKSSAENHIQWLIASAKVVLALKLLAPIGLRWHMTPRTQA